ncbi:MAG: hypothetical protein ABSA40_06895 [Candidatus Dormibacteria bacterium]|jgi:hypothetical protein
MRAGKPTLEDIVTGTEGAYLRVRQGKGAKDRIVPLDTARSRFSKRLVGLPRLDGHFC